jgi:subtilisin family serine protease
LRNQLVLIIILFFNFACSNSPGTSTSSSGGGSGEKKLSRYQPEDPVVIDGDYHVRQDEFFQMDAPFDSELEAGTYTYSLNFPNKPATINFDTGTGELSGYFVEGVETFYDIQITATRDGDNATFTTPEFSIGVNGDPLREHAWHIFNTGQSTFAENGGTSGKDMNLFDTYYSGFTGEGIKVVVSDSGIELNHDDLYQNANIGESKDFSKQLPYTSYPTPYDDDPHGTMVAGIIAARGFNNIGSKGIAPLASIAGYQFIYSDQTTSIMIHQANGDFDIFNYSYGDSFFYDIESDSSYLAQVKHKSENGRDGLGSIFIKASGNEFESCLTGDDFDCIYDGYPWVSHNANFPLENEFPYIVVVGAVDANGLKTDYSNAGSNLWVVAPGGDYGINNPAILTTDLPTCKRGYSIVDDIDNLFNEFEYGHSLNPKCHYTSTMNGTSAATPMVSGAVALILEANPDLTQRDVKHILAMTATQVHAGYTGSNHPGGLNLAGHTYEQGWVTNDAGIKFSNWYGFGMVNISEALIMATDNYTNLDPLIELNPEFDDAAYASATLNANIPDNSAAGVTSSIDVADSLIVESVTIMVNITHARSGEIGIELTSPNGTKSILQNINNSYLISDDEDLENHQLTSHAFYGEDATGNWTIKVIDGDNVSTTVGKLINWKISILGH